MIFSYWNIVIIFPMHKVKKKMCQIDHDLGPHQTCSMLTCLLLLSSRSICIATIHYIKTNIFETL